MTDYFAGKVIWITGASSGIGQALAIELAAHGAQLVLSARREGALQTVKGKCEEQTKSSTARDSSHLVLPLDVTDQASLAPALEQALSVNGRIDMLINNAGISQRSSCLNTDMATYRRLFEVDVFGQIALSKIILPIMIKQSAGHIVVTSSVAGKMGVPFRTGYSAAKHAVMGFFDSLRTEIAHHNIAVSIITPGYIRTSISENALAGDGKAYGKIDANIDRGMSAQDCARVIVKNLAKRKTEISVGKGLEMHALWIKRLFPKWLEKLLLDQYKKRSEVDGFK